MTGKQPPLTYAMLHEAERLAWLASLTVVRLDSIMHDRCPHEHTRALFVMLQQFGDGGRANSDRRN